MYNILYTTILKSFPFPNLSHTVISMWIEEGNVFKKFITEYKLWFQTANVNPFINWRQTQSILSLIGDQ